MCILCRILVWEELGFTVCIHVPSIYEPTCMKAVCSTSLSVDWVEILFILIRVCVVKNYIRPGVL